jgi:alcohol dehydrogenase
VTTTASSRGDALVKKLGADVVVDYTTTPLTSLPPGSFDAAFDTVGADSLTATFALVKPGGLVCSVGGMPEPLTATKDLKRGVGLAVMFWLASFSFRSAARRHGVRYRYLFMHESGAELAELAAMIDAGALTVVTDRVFPFAQALEALAYLEAGRAKGKVVVQLP